MEWTRIRIVRARSGCFRANRGVHPIFRRDQFVDLDSKRGFEPEVEAAIGTNGIAGKQPAKIDHVELVA